jgi:hypothetical protein
MWVGALVPEWGNYFAAIKTQIPMGPGSLIPIPAKLGLKNKKMVG